MPTAAESRLHKQMFLVGLRTAHSAGEMEALIEKHCKHMTPADHTAARAALAQRAAEISPNRNPGEQA